MPRPGYTQLKDTDARMIWMTKIALAMGLDENTHRDRVRIYDFALATLCVKLDGVEPAQVDADTMEQLESEIETYRSGMARHTPAVNIKRIKERLAEAKANALTDPPPWDRDLSHNEYVMGHRIYVELAGTFLPMLTALMRMADTDNAARLKREFPVIAKTLQERYNAPGGVLPEIDGYTAEEWYERKQEADDGG